MTAGQNAKQHAQSDVPVIGEVRAGVVNSMVTLAFTRHAPLTASMRAMCNGCSAGREPKLGHRPTSGGEARGGSRKGRGTLIPTKRYSLMALMAETCTTVYA